VDHVAVAKDATRPNVQDADIKMICLESEFDYISRFQAKLKAFKAKRARGK